MFQHAMIIILILLIYLIYIKKYQISEPMTVVGKGKQEDSVSPPYKGTFTTFNGRMAIDDQYFYDKLFDDVTYYANDYDYDTGALIKTGWEKCKMECSGNCVEYYVSGNSYCFPY